MGMKKKQDPDHMLKFFFAIEAPKLSMTLNACKTVFPTVHFVTNHRPVLLEKIGNT